MTTKAAVRLDRGHGSPYDRGRADSYYRRRFRPHYFPRGSYQDREIIDLTPEQVADYRQGFNDNEDFGDFKNWGED